MADIKKVIEGLEQCISTDKTCFDCPYEGTACTTTLNFDALELLKEQEEEIENLKQTAQSMMEGVCLLKEQEEVSITIDYFDGFGNRTSHCPSCNSRLVWHQNKNYCGECGQAVKWEV